MKTKASPRGLAIGARVRAARERAGLTQEQLSAKASCTLMTINRLENGKTPAPKMTTLERIGAQIDVSAEWLWHGDGPTAASPDVEPYGSFGAWSAVSAKAKQLLAGDVISPEVSARALALLRSYRGTLDDPGVSGWDGLVERAVAKAVSDGAPRASTTLSPRRSTKK
jgi:transcriptional regulator with XRE-family HTH domain